MTSTTLLRRCLPLALLALVGVSHAADDYGYYDDANLQAPDVDFYVGLQASYNNLAYLGGEQEYGFNILLGAYFKEVNFLDLQYGVEMGYNKHGDTRTQSSRFLTLDDFPPGYDFSNVDLDKSTLTHTQQVRVSTLTFGIRLEGSRFYTRFGGALYNYYTREQDLPYIAYLNNREQGDPPPAESSTQTGIAPYAGFGVKIPLEKNLKFTAGFDAYNIESHRMTSVNIGLQYTN